MLVTDILPVLLDKLQIKLASQSGLIYVDIYPDDCQTVTSRMSGLGTDEIHFHPQTSDNSTFI